MSEENVEQHTDAVHEGEVALQEETASAEVAPAKAEVDVTEAVNAAVSSAIADLWSKVSERLPEPEKSDPEDPVVALEGANARIAELEERLAAESYRAAVRDNAEAAGVRAGAALDSALVKASLKDVDLADSKAVVAALKSVSDIEGMDYLKVVTHARVPKNSGEKPSGGRPSGMTLEAYRALDYGARMRFKNEYPAEYAALNGK